MQPSEPVEVKRREFVSAMAAVPTAVTVVAFNDGEQIWGQTVSAFASVTADPPTLLVCINTRSPLHHHLEPGSKFSVNVLAPSQVEIANCFAGKSSEKLPAYASHLLEWDYLDGSVPVLREATSSFSCELESIIPQGTHGVMVGRVTASIRSDDEPLGLAYCNRQYRDLC